VFASRESGKPANESYESNRDHDDSDDNHRSLHHAAVRF